MRYRIPDQKFSCSHRAEKMIKYFTNHIIFYNFQFKILIDHKKCCGLLVTHLGTPYPIGEGLSGLQR